MEESGNEGKYAATVKDVAKWYGVSRAAVYNWLETTDIPHRRLGTLVRFNMEEVDRWAQRRATGNHEAVAAATAAGEIVARHAQGDDPEAV